MPRPIEPAFAVLGTTNPAKQRELRELLTGLPITWLALGDLGDPPEVEETGATFEENALLKARAYAAWSGLPALADDGGLTIDALGGEPGVKSRRWIGGRDAADEELIAYTIERMAGLARERRGAAMRVVEAFVLPPTRSPVHPSALARGAPPNIPIWLADGPAETLGAGEIRGTIAETPSPRRHPGFPFRSVFLHDPAAGRYYDEMEPAEHERMNHRRAALVAIRDRLTPSRL